MKTRSNGMDQLTTSHVSRISSTLLSSHSCLTSKLHPSAQNMNGKMLRHYHPKSHLLGLMVKMNCRTARENVRRTKITISLKTMISRVLCKKPEQSRVRPTSLKDAFLHSKDYVEYQKS